MNIKKFLLPLTFLGLSPSARATDTNTTDSIPQQKQITDFSKITQIPKSTIDFFDAQADSIRRAVNDSISESEVKTVHNHIIKTYNATPEKYNINQLIDLLNKIDHPDKMYEQMRLSMHHANYLANNITPELQNKLNITNKSDIIITAANKRASDMPEYDAFRFIIDGKYFNRLKNPELIMTKALHVATSDITQIGKNQEYKKCIVNIIEFVFQHQNNPKLVKLYSDIFLTTAKIIREYNEQTNNKELYLTSMNTLVPLVEKYNSRITANSVLDTEISIKKPHDFVINQYDNIFTRITLAKIYNQAYLTYMLNPLNLKKRIYGNNTIHSIYIDYIDAIEIQTIARTNKLTPEQEIKLNKLLLSHPEIELFDPYFANVYMNTETRKEIMEFMEKIKFSKSKNNTIPPKILQLLKELQINADNQCQKIINNHINMPIMTLTLPHKISYTDIMNKSNFAPKNVYDRIDLSLQKQYDDVSVQKMSLTRITNNNSVPQQQYSR
jgi:hypothetical protein